MSFWEITGAVGFLIWFAALFAGLIYAAAVGLNKLAYWIEARYETRYTEGPESSVVDRCSVYTLRPRQTLDTLDTVRPRRGDAA